MDINLVKNERRRKGFPPGRRDDWRSSDNTTVEGDAQDENNQNGQDREHGRPSSASARISGPLQGRRGQFNVALK